MTMPTVHKSHIHAFTLIETLAVVMLIGLAAIVMTPMLAGTSDATRLDDAVRRFLYLDARARLLARRESGVMLQIKDGTCVLAIDGEQESELMTQWSHGDQVQLKIETPDAGPTNVIAYDRAGRSTDFDAVVIAGEMHRDLKVAGLTGWVVR